MADTKVVDNQEKETEKRSVDEGSVDWQMSVEEFANNGCLINKN